MKNAEKGSYLSMQFFAFRNRTRQLRALGDMGRRTVRKSHKPPLFSRHLGSGAGGGFSLMPDFSSYAFLCIWNSKESALAHINGDNFQASWSDYADETLSLLLQCSKVHGQWAGQQALEEKTEVEGSQPVAVLTRAKIKVNKLVRFWQYVPKSSRAIENANGCYFSKGVGEWPLSTLATFSIWENIDRMNTFAYNDPDHAEIIQKVRTEGWFAEEMFARFHILAIQGSYQGFSEENITYADTQL